MAAPSDLDALARTRTHALMDALERVRTEALQTEMEALNTFLATRTRDSQKAAIESLAATLIEPLVNELSSAARAEADARVKAVQARMDRAVAEAREQGDQAAADARARAEAESKERADAEIAKARRQSDAAVAALREQSERALAEAREHAAAEVARVSELHRAASEELEAARQQAQAARAEAAEHALRAERAEADIEAAQSASAALLADIEEVREALASAQASLAAAQADLAAAQAETAAVRAESVAIAEALQTRWDLLDRLSTALHWMQGASSGEAVFGVVLDQLMAHFERTAVLLAGSSGLKCWLHRGFDGDAPEGLIVQSSLSPAMQALATARIAEHHDVAGDSTIEGLRGTGVAAALAIPIVVRERAIAVAYAESDGPLSREDFDAARKIAEILVEIGSRRVNSRPRRGESSGIEPAGAAPAEAAHAEPEIVYAVKRRTRRVRMRDAVNITLEGSASFLVDLSTAGAQVLAPVPLRPKQDVHLTLVIGERAVECRGRIVWALFEQAKGARAALYRAGLEFTQVDTAAVESFLASESLRLQRSA